MTSVVESPNKERRDMAEKNKPAGKVKEAFSAEKVTRSAPVEKAKGMEVPAPKKVLQGSVMNALKLPGLRKVLHSLALTRLLRVLRMIVGFVGIRAIPIVALIIGVWILRRSRKR
jgi:hypothetical protein